MVSYFNQLRESGCTPFDAVLQEALVRLRTVLMTALLAILGLHPMALSKGIGSEVQKPPAVVIIGAPGIGKSAHLDRATDPLPLLRRACRP